MRTILSLFDWSGNWPRYFREAGYHVILVDLKHGRDVLTYKPPIGIPIYGILAALPCTEFAVSGAQYWKQKDKDGRTAAAVKLLARTMDLIDTCDPEFWMLENPVGRLRDWMGPPKVYVDPCEYAGYAPDPETDRYTKKTGLWGKFKLPVKAPREPIKTCSQGSWVQQLGGKSERTKELRSITPLGLSYATYLGNRSR